MPAIASELRRARFALERWAVRERPARRHRWLPRPTVRLRLTLLYGSLFLVAGALLLGITYALAAKNVGATSETVVFSAPRLTRVAGHASGSAAAAPPSASTPPGGRLIFQQQNLAGRSTVQIPSGVPVTTVRRIQNATNTSITSARHSQLDALLVESAIALAIMSLVSILLGWLVAGRVLRPVRTMNTRARQISAHNLHQRLALGGRDDELKELGDTFDELLGRLERAFESQRRFVANASHELRTPVTVERTLVEVALADPDAGVDSLRETLARVLVTGQQQERTIEALLTLARSQRDLQANESVDLAAVGAEALEGAESGAVRLEGRFEPAAVRGDPGLVERLVANLIENAVRYNVPGGWVAAGTSVDGDGRAVLSVANSGPVVPAGDTARLLEPFRRLNGDRTGHGGGVGLGLSIVDAIAIAHRAELRVVARPEGGLEVSVAFPRSA
jgi:signal transduction histidine kinase